MSQETVSALYSQIRQLSLEEQRALNSMLVANIRLGIKVASVQKSIQFKRGDVIVFDGKTRGTIFLEVTGFSRDLTKIKGKQLNRGLKTSTGTPWTVTASAAKAATREQALAW